MGVATHPTDFSDLYTDLQNRVREATGVTATENIAKRFINTGLFDMHIGYGEQFHWCERNAILQARTIYTRGLVTIPRGSTTLTGVADADGLFPQWNTNDDFSVTNARAGGRMTINGGTDVYEVDSVTSDTELELTSPFISTTIDGTTQTDNGGSYQYFEDEYTLASDFLRPLDLQQFSDNWDIPLMDRREFRARWPRNRVPGHPKAATIVGKPFSGNTTPIRKVRLHPPPDGVYMIPYSYITSNLAVTAAGAAQTELVNDTDEPIVPRTYRHLIVQQALIGWYRDRKDDARSQEAKAEFVDLLTRVTSDVEVGDKRPSVRPRSAAYWSRARAPWRGAGSRFDINGRFDRLEDR